MQRIVVGGVRKYSSSIMRRSEGGAAASKELVLNFCTPHEPIYENKVVDYVALPGESGEYGVNAGLAPVISQLKPGVVQVTHVGGETEKFFIPGGFAITHDNNVTDVSVSEAYPLSDFDEAGVRSGYAAAQQSLASSDEVEKTKGMIEIDTYQALGRALGISL